MESLEEKSGKKRVIILIVLALIITIAVGIIGVFLYTKKDTTNNIQQSVNTISKGQIELVYTTEGKEDKIFTQNSFEVTKRNNYFSLWENGKEYTINYKGVKIGGDHNISYIGDDYFDDSTKNKIIKENEEVIDYSQMDGFRIKGYKDEILYYTTMIKKDAHYEYKIHAYNLKEKKRIWELDVDSSISNFKIGEKYIGFDKYKHQKQSSFEKQKKEYFTVIVDFDGKIIVEETEDFDIIATSSDYYIKTKENEYIEVYDYKNNKISEHSLKENNAKVRDVLENGMYILMEPGISESSKKETEISNLYNINADIIQKDCYIDQGTNTRANNAVIHYLKGYSLLAENGIDVLEKANIFSNGNSFRSYYLYNAINDYITMNTHEDENHEYKLVNVKKQKSMTMSFMPEEDFEQSPNANYVIIYNPKKEPSYSYVIDSDFNILIESDKFLTPVNDEYVLERVSSTEIYLLNVLTGDKKKIDFKGEYKYNNATGMVTQDDEHYYLYAFK